MGVQKVEQAVLEAARCMGLNVVWCRERQSQNERATWGFTPSNAEEGASPNHGVFEAQYVPFDWLLPQASVVVCHGGAGTVFSSLREGVPVVICRLPDDLLPVTCWLSAKPFLLFVRFITYVFLPLFR